MYDEIIRRTLLLLAGLNERRIRLFHNILTVYGRIRYAKTYIEEQWDGSNPNAEASKVACFVHYDAKGIVHDYVLHYLEEIANSGYRIHFCSNAPKFPRQMLERIEPYCEKIYRRKNQGYDFGAYKEMVREVQTLPDVDQVMIMNDSVYGPFGGLSALLEKIDLDDADIWGVSDSWQFKYHLHSFFFVINARALRSEAFQKYWKNLPFVGVRSWVIQKGEIGFTQDMLRAGLSVRALYPYDKVTETFLDYVQQENLLENKAMFREQQAFLEQILQRVDTGKPLNSTHHFWELLIGHMGYPFAKRDLLEKNPGHIPGLTSWRKIISATGYDTDLIVQHLKVRVRDRSL